MDVSIDFLRLVLRHRDLEASLETLEIRLRYKIENQEQVVKIRREHFRGADVSDLDKIDELRRIDLQLKSEIEDLTIEIEEIKRQLQAVKELIHTDLRRNR